MEFFKVCSPFTRGSVVSRSREIRQNIFTGSMILRGIPDFSPNLQGVAHHARRYTPEMPQPGIDAIEFFPHHAFLGFPR